MNTYNKVLMDIIFITKQLFPLLICV